MRKPLNHNMTTTTCSSSQKFCSLLRFSNLFLIPYVIFIQTLSQRLSLFNYLFHFSAPKFTTTQPFLHESQYINSNCIHYPLTFTEGKKKTTNFEFCYHRLQIIYYKLQYYPTSHFKISMSSKHYHFFSDIMNNSSKQYIQ